ncbi:cytochrome c oxidase subunit 5B, mitochondrial-like [Uranotaenia lowii]|uniref:cytochrome c oxidase subunit 5B, mitochondrial-like n=1 Tax=Uranotaenia lowii TaxID=190385 RepID=UPI00247A9F85|nr:cytochrome c oxidase subunit 5B, mitochondrial-like [Uranotaenia lowii]
MACAFSCRNLFLTTAKRPPVRWLPVTRGCKLMNDSLDHATGIEKRELLAHQAGDHDPFNLEVLKKGPGTKDNPNIVFSAFEYRLIGCICDEDSITVQYMPMRQGELKRCECGHWFKMIHKAPV